MAANSLTEFIILVPYTRTVILPYIVSPSHPFYSFSLFYLIFLMWLALFWLFLLFLFFRHQVVINPSRLFRWTLVSNLRPRTMTQTVNPWCSPPDQGASLSFSLFIQLKFTINFFSISLHFTSFFTNSTLLQ